VRTERSAPAIVVTLLGLALAAALSGCGIRSTSVPVDAGAAPSRVSCTVPSAAASAGASAGASAADDAGQETVPIYLVCSEEVTAIPRPLPRPLGDGGDSGGAVSPSERLAAARTLLYQLRAKPDSQESASGFSTEVPGDLDVSGPRRSDPATTLRLSAAQSQLPSFALAQIVCTFGAGTATSGTAGTADGTVMLGFADNGAARRFSCTGDLRSRQEAAESAGTAVR
jgi:hypothetical protein